MAVIELEMPSIVLIYLKMVRMNANSFFLSSLQVPVGLEANRANVSMERVRQIYTYIYIQLRN